MQFHEKKFFTEFSWKILKKKFLREIDLFDFTSFFFGLDFFKFSGPLCLFQCHPNVFTNIWTMISNNSQNATWFKNPVDFLVKLWNIKPVNSLTNCYKINGFFFIIQNFTWAHHEFNIGWHICKILGRQYLRFTNVNTNNLRKYSDSRNFF